MGLFKTCLLMFFLINFYNNIVVTCPKKLANDGESRSFIGFGKHTATERPCICNTTAMCACCQVVKILYTLKPRRLCFNMIYQANVLNFELTLDALIMKSMTVASYRPFQMCEKIPGVIFSTACVTILELRAFPGPAVTVCPRMELSTKKESWSIPYTCSTLMPAGAAGMMGMVVVMPGAQPGMVPGGAARPQTPAGGATGPATPGAAMMPMMPAGGAAGPPIPGAAMMPMMPAGGAAGPPIPGAAMMPMMPAGGAAGPPIPGAAMMPVIPGGATRPAIPPGGAAMPAIPPGGAAMPGGVARPMSVVAGPSPATGLMQPSAALIQPRPAAGATGAIPPTGATGMIPPTGATGMIPPTGAMGMTPPAGVTGARPSAGATGMFPPTGAMGAIPPAGATGMFPPAGSTGMFPPTGSMGMFPPTGAMGAIPPAGGAGARPPGTGVGIMQPGTPVPASSLIVPRITSVAGSPVYLVQMNENLASALESAMMEASEASASMTTVSKYQEYPEEFASEARLDEGIEIRESQTNQPNDEVSLISGDDHTGDLSSEPEINEKYLKVDSTMETERKIINHKRNKRNTDIFDVLHQSNRCERAYRICITKSKHYIVSRIRNTKQNGQVKNDDCGNKVVRIVNEADGNLCTHSNRNDNITPLQVTNSPLESDDPVSFTDDNLSAIIIKDENNEGSDFHPQNHHYPLPLMTYAKAEMYPSRIPPVLLNDELSKSLNDSILQETLENLSNDKIIMLATKK